MRFSPIFSLLDIAGIWCICFLSFDYHDCDYESHTLTLPFSYTHNEWLLFVQKSIYYYYYSTGRQTQSHTHKCMHSWNKQHHNAPSTTKKMSTSLTNFPSWRQKTQCYTHNKEKQLFFEWLMNWRKETSDWKMTKRLVRRRGKTTHTWNLAIDTLVLLPSMIKQRRERERERKKNEKWLGRDDMHGFHIKHDQVYHFLLFKIESGGKSTYIIHLLMLLSLPIFVFTLKHKSSLRHSYNNLSHPQILYQISPSERQNRQEIVIISSRELLSLCFISNRSRQQSSSSLNPFMPLISLSFLSWSTQNKQRIVIVIIPILPFRLIIILTLTIKALRQDKRAKP